MDQEKRISCSPFGPARQKKVLELMGASIEKGLQILDVKIMVNRELSVLM